jgi:hypothetical protein
MAYFGFSHSSMASPEVKTWHVSLKYLPLLRIQRQCSSRSDHRFSGTPALQVSSVAKGESAIAGTEECDITRRTIERKAAPVRSIFTGRPHSRQ